MTTIHDLVSDSEISGQLRELGVRNPHANRMLREAQRGRITLRDAVYWVLLDEVEKAKHAAHSEWSAAVPSFGA